MEQKEAKKCNQAWAKATRKRIEISQYQSLLDKYSYMFKHKVTGCMDAPFALFGFECGEGWFDIIKKLCSQIDELLTKKDKKSFRVIQVKEKFGTLRFYTSFITNEIEKAINEAEKLSGETCESCGAKGTMRNRYDWLMVRCDKCWEKENKSRRVN